MVMFPSPATAAMLVLVVLLLQLQLWSAEAQVAVGSGPPAGCPSPDRCGNVSVPFPFGIRAGCSLAGFDLTCDTTTNPPRLMIGNGTLQVVSISLADATVRALDLAGAVNITYDGNVSGNGTWRSLGATVGGPFVVADLRNQLVVTGCNIHVTLMGDRANGITGCSSFCSINDRWTSFVANVSGNASCSGIGCCKTPIPIGRTSYLVDYKTLESSHEHDNKLPNVVRIAEQGWFDGAVAADLLDNSKRDKSPLTPVPVVLDWVVAFTLETALFSAQTGQFADDGNWSCPTAGSGRKTACLSTFSVCRNITGNYRLGYVCQCDKGYDGNPYVTDGCQDIDECERAEEHGCFGECTNTRGAFLCRCPRGARGNATIPNGCTKSNLGNYRLGYVCQCDKGYDGNPYVAGGCQDINECKRAKDNGCFGDCINTPGSFICRCPRGAPGNESIPNGCVKSNLGLGIGIGVGSGAGLLVVALGVALLTRRIKNRRAKMLKRKFFMQNRGYLLQQLVSQKADIAERMIIPLAELEKATNNFDESRELGGGGHGTVYKGILSDLHVVAIKKSKVTIQREIDEFINEVAILSQINHRNVVKLFGCCFETEVPLLVYEFISNGTLYHHLHVEVSTSLPWEDRLRIATETARALAYLHSAVSFPVIHRDIKSHNILLDGSLTTKVSDFGASRCIPAEQTGVTTAIQGTMGYLDPMYYYTGRLTEKSDVYSFGVVLMELLTRKKPYSYRSPEDDSLVAHFTTLLAHGNLGDILDHQVMEEGNKEVNEVAMLAVACVKLKAEERPTMRHVEMKLESVRSSSLQQEVLHSVSTKKSKENHVSWSHTISEGTSLESTRQYSLEEEYLLSSRYPR